MIYVTIKLPKIYHQMSLEDLLFSSVDAKFNSYVKNYNETSTRTYEFEKLSNKIESRTNVYYLVKKLEMFVNSHEDLYNIENRHSLYREFYIPKKSGGLRKIDAPNAELMNALRELKTIFEQDFGALYHTNAFAYIKKRSTLDAVKRHQYNESNWYGKYDLHNFFGSTTLDYVMYMLSMIYPFNMVINTVRGKEMLAKALDLAFLDGGLPQGTPISPLITNLIMIPVDYKLSQCLINYKKQKYIYTRYADDFIISSKYDFSFREIENLIVDTLKFFGAPFTINSKKTRYGSRSGRNFNLGVMLNTDNNITVGYKKKKQFQTMLFNYGMDRKNGVQWSKEDVQHMEGLRSYYHMVEGKTIDNIVSFVSQKIHADIMSMIKEDLGRKVSTSSENFISYEPFENFLF